MSVDKIKHTKPASKRTFLDELEPIPYEITEEELAAMNPRMKEILFGIPQAPSRPAALPQGEEEDFYDDPYAEEGREEEEIVMVDGQPVVYTAPPPYPEYLDAVPPYTEESELPGPADFADLLELPGVAEPHVTLIFPLEEGEDELRQAAEAVVHRWKEWNGKRLYSTRFGSGDSEALQALNEIIGQREGVTALVNGKKVSYARSLWLPLMYVFSAGKTDEGE